MAKAQRAGKCSIVDLPAARRAFLQQNLPYHVSFANMAGKNANLDTSHPSSDVPPCDSPASAGRMCCGYTGSGLNCPSLKAANKLHFGPIEHTTVYGLADIACNALDNAIHKHDAVLTATDWRAAYTILPTNNNTTLLTIISFSFEGRSFYALFWSEWFGKCDVGYKWEPFSRVFFDRAHSRLLSSVSSRKTTPAFAPIAGHHTDDYIFACEECLVADAVSSLIGDTLLASLPNGIETNKTRTSTISEVYGIIIDLEREVAATAASVIARLFHLLFCVLPDSPRVNDRVPAIDIQSLHGVLAFMKPTCQPVAPLSYPLNGALKNRSQWSKDARWTAGSLAILGDTRLIERNLRCLRRSALPPAIGGCDAAELERWWAHEAALADIVLWVDASLLLRTVGTVVVTAATLKDGSQLTNPISSLTQTSVPPNLFAPHAPPTCLTINVLELLSLLSGLVHAISILNDRLGNTINGARVFIWGDSTVAYSWLRSNKSDSFPTSALLFAIMQAQTLTGVRLTTGWVPSEGNPADKPSRHIPFTVPAPPPMSPPIALSPTSAALTQSLQRATLPALWGHTLVASSATFTSAATSSTSIPMETTAAPSTCSRTALHGT